MSMQAYLTHGIAIGLGLTVAMIAAPKHGDPAPAAPTPTPAITSTLPYAEMWDLAAVMPMEPALRDYLEPVILEEWIAREPQEFLKWIGNRPWQHEAYTALEHLARTDPEALLAYGKQEGVEPAFRVLTRHGDAHHVLRMLKARGEEQILEDYAWHLFFHGNGMDLEFYNQLHELAGSRGLSGGAETCGRALWKTGRHERFVEWMQQEKEWLPLAQLGKEFGSFRRLSPYDPALLTRLPKEAARAALPTALESLDTEEQTKLVAAYRRLGLWGQDEALPEKPEPFD